VIDASQSGHCFEASTIPMSAADHWLRQVLMYGALPNEWFAEAPLQ
jgi:hypothetical protein